MPDRKEETAEQMQNLSRRGFLKGVGTGVAGTTVITTAAIPATEQIAEASQGRVDPGTVPLTLNVNGKTYTVKAEPRETLLEVLRNRLDVTGPKPVCEHGSCGACTVHLDGKPVYACMMLAVQAQGKAIKTIEGLAQGDKLHPVQQSFIDKDALQCGFCTPGFIMSVTSVLDEDPNATVEDVKQGIAGHICRCGAYKQIVEAADLLCKR